jgi:DNA-directed RNA polymerase specialized sigma24 family protein
MSTSGDVTFWIGQLKLGDRRAAQAIWDRYFERLAHFARQKLDKLPRRVADEEDAALSALHSFCRGAEAGRFPQLSDRHDLWLLLMTITARKVRAQTRRRKAEKRGGGKVRGESGFEFPGDDAENMGIERVLGREPTPEMVNMMTEECEQLLGLLEDESMRQVALLKLDGFTEDKIAQKLDCVPRTVLRTLKHIRAIWSSEFD